MIEDPKNDDKKESFQSKLSDTFENLKKSENFENFYQYATHNVRDTIAYALLIVALVLLLFVPFWGGLIIGLVGGVYFSDEIISMVQNFNTIIEQQGISRSVILGVTLLAFFISAPAIFIGAAVAMGIKRLFVPE